MGLVFLIMLGAVLGWLATIIAPAGSSSALKLNIATGVAGALLAGLVVNPLIGEGNLLKGDYSVGALLVSLLGAVALLVSANLLRRSEMR